MDPPPFFTRATEFAKRGTACRLFVPLPHDGPIFF